MQIEEKNEVQMWRGEKTKYLGTELNTYAIFKSDAKIFFFLPGVQGIANYESSQHSVIRLAPA